MSERRVSDIFAKAERFATPDPDHPTWWDKGSGHMSWDQIPGMAELLVQQMNEQSALSSVHAAERIKVMAAWRRAASDHAPPTMD